MREKDKDTMKGRKRGGVSKPQGMQREMRKNSAKERERERGKGKGGGNEDRYVEEK